MHILTIAKIVHQFGGYIVTPTDRTQSVCNRCVIKLFVALFMLSHCPFDITDCEEALVIGLSQISSFLSPFIYYIYVHIPSHLIFLAKRRPIDEL